MCSKETAVKIIVCIPSIFQKAPVEGKSATALGLLPGFSCHFLYIIYFTSCTNDAILKLNGPDSVSANMSLVKNTFLMALETKLDYWRVCQIYFQNFQGRCISSCLHSLCVHGTCGSPSDTGKAAQDLYSAFLTDHSSTGQASTVIDQKSRVHPVWVQHTQNNFLECVCVCVYKNIHTHKITRIIPFFKK